MADWQTYVVYFKSTGTLAASNTDDGRWVTSFPSAAEADTYRTDTDNIAAAVAQYGDGELRRSTAPVSVPFSAGSLLSPGASFFNYGADTPALQNAPIVRFPLREAYLASGVLLDQLGLLLTSVAHRYPMEDVTLAHDAIFEIRRGAWHQYTNSGPNSAATVGVDPNISLGAERRG